MPMRDDNERVMATAPTLFSPQAQIQFSPGFLFPSVTSIPLSSAILHEDAKKNINVQFEQQNIELAGHFSELSGAIDSGLAEINSSIYGLAEINSLIGENVVAGVRQLDRTVSKGFYGLDEQLCGIRFSLDGIRQEAREGLEAVTRGLTRMAIGIDNLNKAAWNPEFAWSSEQAAFALQAFVVRDLSTAEQRINYAISGFGSHSGTPVHSQFHLQHAEILIAKSTQADCDKALAVLNSAKPYVEYYGDEKVAGRWHFASGGAWLQNFVRTQSRDALNQLDGHFLEAERLPTFWTKARIHRVHSHYLAGRRDEAAELCADLLTRAPRSFLELARIGSVRMDKDFLLPCIEHATRALFNGDAELRDLMERTLGVRKFVVALSNARNLREDFPSTLGGTVSAAHELESQMTDLAGRLAKLASKGSFWNAIQYRQGAEEVAGVNEKIETMRNAISSFLR